MNVLSQAMISTLSGKRPMHFTPSEALVPCAVMVLSNLSVKSTSMTSGSIIIAHSFMTTSATTHVPALSVSGNVQGLIFWPSEPYTATSWLRKNRWRFSTPAHWLCGSGQCCIVSGTASLLALFRRIDRLICVPSKSNCLSASLSTTA